MAGELKDSGKHLEGRDARIAELRATLNRANELARELEKTNKCEVEFDVTYNDHIISEGDVQQVTVKIRQTL